MIYDIAIVAVPYVVTSDPIMAPAVLKSSVENAGFSAIALDLNIGIYNVITNHPRKQHLLDFMISQIIHDDVIDDIIELIDYCASKILSHDCKIIGLSLLTYSCQIFTRWLCVELRQRAPSKKIVIGGTGIKNFVADQNTAFCTQVKQLGLIDDFISGDGEESLVEYLRGNLSYPGINKLTWKPITDLNLLPFPDYSDYNFGEYGRLVVPLSDSRGCIRNCEFCDIIEYWQKFQWRYAENIWKEMLFQYEKTGIRHFAFHNALVNGNFKEFKKLLDFIVAYNSLLPVESQISWEGFFIVRPMHLHPDGLWEKLGKSNGKLHVGVESVIQRVRNTIGKTFSNDDIDFHLEMARIHKVPLMLLLIVGYPTETLEDYDTTKQWIKDRAYYANNGVNEIRLSFAAVLPNTKLHRKADEYGIKMGSLPSIWYNENLKITSEVRIQYFNDLHDICKEHNFTILSNDETLEFTHDINFDYE